MQQKHFSVKTFLVILLLQLAFFFSNFFFFVYLKDKLQNYLQLFTSFSTQIGTLQQLSFNSTEELTQLAMVVQPLESATREASLLAFVATPIVLWLLWSFFQTTQWFFLRRRHIYQKRFFVNVAIISAILLTVYFFILYRLLQVDFVYIESNILTILLVTFFFYSVLTLYFLTLRGRSFVKDVRSILTKETVRLIPRVLFLFVVALCSFYLFVILLLSAIVGEYSLITFPSLMTAIVVVSVLSSLLKIHLSKQAETLRE